MRIICNLNLAVWLVLFVAGCKVVSIPASPAAVIPVVDVGGSVRLPQAVPIPGDGLRLWPALIRAGGIVPPVVEADVAPSAINRLVVLLHRANRRYYFALPFVQGQAAGEIQLAPGDVVSVVPVEETPIGVSIVNGGMVRDDTGNARRGTSLRSLESAGTRSTAQSSSGGVMETAPVPVRPPKAAPQAGGSVSETPPGVVLSDNVPLGDCEIPQPVPLGGRLPDTRDPLGNPAGAIVVVRQGVDHPAISELYVFPTQRLADSLGRTTFDPALFDRIHLPPDAEFAFANLEQLPIVSASLVAPHIKAALDQARWNELQSRELARNRIFGEDLPFVGGLFRCAGQGYRKCTTIAVESYPTTALPPILPAPVPANPGYPLSVGTVPAVP